MLYVNMYAFIFNINTHTQNLQFEFLMIKNVSKEVAFLFCLHMHIKLIAFNCKLLFYTPHVE